MLEIWTLEVILVKTQKEKKRAGEKASVFSESTEIIRAGWWQKYRIRQHVKIQLRKGKAALQTAIDMASFGEGGELLGALPREDGVPRMTKGHNSKHSSEQHLRETRGLMHVEVPFQE